MSQQIRDRIKRGLIITNTTNLARLDRDQKEKKKGWFDDDALEKRVQPSSYDPTIDDHLYRISTEGRVFRPERNESVRRALLQIPRGKRERVSIDGGYELKTGSTYLIPLQDRIILKEGERVKSSPKSSTGRLFPRTRLLADFNPCMDEVDGIYKPETDLGLWLLVQPTKFNFIVHPKLSLNQMIFAKGSDFELTDAEIQEMLATHAILYEKGEGEELVPAQHIVRDGLQLHLDLRGSRTEGIVGLRARDNPEPIDLSRAGHFNAEDYFEPIESKDGTATLRRKDHCLWASSEVLKMPHESSAELDRHCQIGIRGTLDEAGFVDNGFAGDLVFEITSHEPADITLRHGMPISRLRFFRTSENPDKLYGREETGSHYQDQLGPRVSKHFRQFDYRNAAKNWAKLDRMVLTEDAQILLVHRTTERGYEPISEETAEALTQTIQRGFFH